MVKQTVGLAGLILAGSLAWAQSATPAKPPAEKRDGSTLAQQAADTKKSPELQPDVLSASTKTSASPLVAAPNYSTAIADNSFFIEEAFNQERGVVQHISNFLYSRGDGFFYTFTQEWPAPNERHQISISMPYASLSGTPREHGIGDILLNYRFGAVQKPHVAFAPRVSLVMPTGRNSRGLGNGSAGVQFNVPVSHRISESWIYHLNAGATLLPRGRGLTVTGPVRRNLHSYNLGGSIIWLAKPNFNAMLETFANYGAEIDSTGSVVRSTDVFVSPGFRWAINAGSMQIVPGIGVPFRVNRGPAPRGVMFYLSFEHPFGRTPKP